MRCSTVAFPGAWHDSLAYNALPIRVDESEIPCVVHISHMQFSRVLACIPRLVIDPA